MSGGVADQDNSFITSLIIMMQKGYDTICCSLSRFAGYNSINALKLGSTQSKFIKLIRYLAY